MDTSTSSLREQGLQALRQGQIDQAVDLLARAVIADGRDAEAQAFLGVAYSQKGLHAQAKRALQSAVALQPQSASYQFNLGVALEHSGDLQGAAAAYRLALQLNPEHPQARARLQALSAATPARPVAAAAPAAPGAAHPEAPWLVGKDPAASTPQTGPHGSVQCSHCKQWSKPGLSCEWCSSPLKSSPAPATAPWLQGPYASAADTAPREYGYSTAPDMSAGEAFARRFAASFIDGIIVEVMALIAGFMLGIAVAGASAGNPAAARSSAGALGFVLGVVIATVYYAGMLSAWGRTLGKMALGLRVVGPDGGNPSFLRAVLREIVGKTVSGIVLCLGYLWMLWDGEQQTWHDKIAGTSVERA